MSGAGGGSPWDGGLRSPGGAAAGAGFAPLNSPAFTGTPTAPTAAPGTNTTQLATTAFDTAAVAVETARATAAEALKAPIASPTFTGTPAAPTAAAGTNTTQLATTAFVTQAVGPGLVLRGFLGGLGLTVAATSVTVAAGQAASSDATTMMALASALQKNTAGAWVAGNNQNGMGQGLTIANSTTYHIFEILVSGAVDVYIDTSVSAANAPAGTTKSRRIGSLNTNGSAQFVAVIQNGNRFDLATPFLEVSGTPGVTTAITKTLASLPVGIIVQAILSGNMADGVATDPVLYISSLAQTDIAPSGTAAVTAQIGTAASASALAGYSNQTVFTNTSAQIRYRVSSASTSIDIINNGWIDTRGQG